MCVETVAMQIWKRAGNDSPEIGRREFERRLQQEIRQLEHPGLRKGVEEILQPCLDALDAVALGDIGLDLAPDVADRIWNRVRDGIEQEIGLPEFRHRLRLEIGKIPSASLRAEVREIIGTWIAGLAACRFEPGVSTMVKPRPKPAPAPLRLEAEDRADGGAGINRDGTIGTARRVSAGVLREQATKRQAETPIASLPLALETPRASGRLVRWLITAASDGGLSVECCDDCLAIETTDDAGTVILREAP